jgi:hypothetical protein
MDQQNPGMSRSPLKIAWRRTPDYILRSDGFGRNDAVAVGCEPKLWDQAAAFDDASGWLRLAGADGLSASAAQ